MRTTRCNKDIFGNPVASVNMYLLFSFCAWLSCIALKPGRECPYGIRDYFASPLEARLSHKPARVQRVSLHP